MQSSIWFQTLSAELRTLLEASDPLPRTADVIIVGAGMIGLATAYYLSEAGVSGICVIDRDTALAEASGANAGGLWFGQPSPELGPLTPLAKASSRLYDELSAKPEFDFNFRRTGLLALGACDESYLRLVHQAGFRAEGIGPSDLYRLEPALRPGLEGAVLYPDEGQLHPAKLGAAFIRCLKQRSVRLCFNTEVERVGPRCETSAGDIKAGIIVIASGAWTPLVTRALGWSPPIKPMRGQLLATEPLPPTLRHTVLGERFYYWQLSEGHIAGGGTVEDVGFERGVNPQDIASIREEMNAVFPQLAAVPTRCAWSGFRPYCQDLRPVLGKVPGQQRVYVAAGHFKKGIMLAPVTGKVLAELITTGTTSLPIESLDPGRFGAV